MKWLICLMVLVGMMGCGKGNDPTSTGHSVRFEVVSEGGAKTADISYYDANEQHIQLNDFILPWHYEFSAPSGRTLYLSAASTSGYGIYGTIKVDGTTKTESPIYCKSFVLEYTIP